MTAIWLLSVAFLALLVVFVVLLGRRTRDDMQETVRSFDDFRDALSPGISRLRSGTERLGERLDRDERPTPPG